MSVRGERVSVIVGSKRGFATVISRNRDKKGRFTLVQFDNGVRAKIHNQIPHPEQKGAS